ncbi:hypothetical protein K492DRAFT_199135 [Lichtheimia hyalospora FSU 10163]|nr:hypothetical protein K492DRAFT_199135 [Lichtheimia hyalospora FSU 10163]
MFLMMLCTRYFMLWSIVLVSTLIFARSLGVQLEDHATYSEAANPLGQVEGALSSATLDPLSLNNLQVPVVPPTTQVSHHPSEHISPPATGTLTTTTTPTMTGTMYPTSISATTYTSRTPSATHTPMPPPTSNAGMQKGVTCAICIIVLSTLFWIYTGA